MVAVQTRLGPLTVDEPTLDGLGDILAALSGEDMPGADSLVGLYRTFEDEYGRATAEGDITAEAALQLWRSVSSDLLRLLAGAPRVARAVFGACCRNSDGHCIGAKAGELAASDVIAICDAMQTGGVWTTLWKAVKNSSALAGLRRRWAALPRVSAGASREPSEQT